MTVGAEEAQICDQVVEVVAVDVVDLTRSACTVREPHEDLIGPLARMVLRNGEASSEVRSVTSELLDRAAQVRVGAPRRTDIVRSVQP